MQSWLVTDKASLEDLKRLLGVSETPPPTGGRSGRAKTAGKPRFTGQVMGDQLFLYEAVPAFQWPWQKSRLADPAEQKRLSAGREIYFAQCNLKKFEMHTSLWRDGVEVWNSRNRNQKNPPEEIDPARRQSLAPDNFVFAIPDNLDWKALGYEDREPKPEEEPFELYALAKVSSS